jgi:DNA replication ATP-dependent helicase Dna2
MIIPNESHVKFYDLEIGAHLKNWLEFTEQKVSSLIAEKKLFVGLILSFDESTGCFRMRFKKDQVLRQNSQYFFGLLGPAVLSFRSLSEWTFKYKEFRNSKPDSFWLDRIGGDANTQHCTRVTGDYVFFDLQIHDRMTSKIVRDKLTRGGEAIALLTEPDPPLKYLENLRDFVRNNPENSICNLNIDYKIDDWTPHLVDNTDSIASEIERWSMAHDLVVIQGPPGTGKSFNVAEYCHILLAAGKTVCICSLANRALVEIALQPGLRSALELKKVYKTNLSDFERAEVPFLQDFEPGIPLPGTLLLSTFYKLSDIANHLLRDQVRFDVVIVEEASQAFLATVALFQSVARKIILIGDHMQLPPVALTINKLSFSRVHPKLESVVNGMTTIACAFEEQSYRLTRTRRLMDAAASLTGNFYNGTLRSVSPLNHEILGRIKQVGDAFDGNGGSTLIELPIAHREYGRNYVERLVRHLVTGIRSSGDFSIAVLVPRVAFEVEFSVNLVQAGLYGNRITVSTVHKVQGITVDYTILYLPLVDSMIELEEKFFNVATSRARRGTVIITSESLRLLRGVSPRVLRFLGQCSKVSPNAIGL